MTSMVALAFLVPLGMAVDQLAEVRAISEAQRQSAVVVAVLTVTTDPAKVDQAIKATAGPAVGRIAVHKLGVSTVGDRRAPTEEIELVAARQRSIVKSVTGGMSYLEPVDIGEGRTAVVEVYIPGEELDRGVARAWWALTVVALVLVGASVFVGDRLAAKVVGSARGLAKAAVTLGEGKLDVRVAPSGPRELAEAGLAFNMMAQRITALVANERELVADLSHRLRTPLTALKLDVDTLGDGRGTQRIRNAVAVLEDEVDKLIRAARKPAVVEAEEPPSCDASEVVRDRMRFWSAVAGDQGRWCQAIGVDREAPVPVPRGELGAALDALLGNVFRYTPQGAPFEVAVSRRDGYVAIRVEDGGPGIADPDRALRRGETDHGSTGLGLDIVRRLAEAGNGAVDVGRGQLGGASVVILLSDAQARPKSPNRFGLVGRISREPVTKGHKRRA